MSSGNRDFLMFLMLLPLSVGTAVVLRMCLLVIFDNTRSKGGVPILLSAIHMIGRIITAWKEPTPLSRYTSRELRDELERREAEGKK